MQELESNLKIAELLEDKHIPSPYLEYIELILISISSIYQEKDISNLISKTNFIFNTTNIIKDQIKGYKNEKALTKTNIDNELNITYTIIINTDYQATTYQIIEFISHELNNIYCSLKQTFIKKDNELLFHNGLFVSNLNNSKNYGKTLNEVYNSYQTEKIIEQIKSIDPLTIDDKLYKTVTELNNSIPKHIKSPRYPNEVALFREFLSNEQIKKIVDNNIKNGNVLVIEEIFNSILGKDSYQSLNNKLDELSDYLHKSKKLKVREISILNCEIRNIIQNFTKNYKEA